MTVTLTKGLIEELRDYISKEYGEHKAMSIVVQKALVEFFQRRKKQEKREMPKININGA